MLEASRSRLIDELAGVDWSANWLVPYRDAGQRVAARCCQGASLAAALNAEWLDSSLQTGGSSPILLATGVLQFVAQAELPPGCAYEAFIAETSSVPTRDNLHDLFNGLAWLRWPALKRRLNEMQATELRTHGVGARRGAVRDALTLFDENAAWVQLPPALEQALTRRDWIALFVARRAEWANAKVTLFGHALIEKLVLPRKAITAHAWLLPGGLAPEDVEPWLCEAMTPQRLAGRPFQALPVLGVPGWWPANEAPGFYADPAVFRPLRAEPDPTAVTARPQRR